MVSQIYKEAIMCARKNNTTNEIRCIKNKLKNYIGEDRDKLIALKLECQECGLEIPGFIMAFEALLLAFVALLHVEVGYKVVLWIGCMLVVIYVIVYFKHYPQYRKVLFILEEIEREMQK